MYRVAIKPSAIAENDPLAAVRDRRGDCLAFEDRADAEAFAAEHSTPAARVAVQAAAPQDDAVDGYLVASPRRYTHEPKPGASDEDGDGSGATFDVSGNQYGALAEALLVGDHGVAGGLQYAVWDALDLGGDPGDYRVAARSATTLPVDATDFAWVPDAVLDVYRDDGGSDTTDSPLRTVYCEFKAGDASFQRDQRAAMADLADRHAVLAVRVSLEGLPQEYGLSVRLVDSDEPWASSES